MTCDLLFEDGLVYLNSRLPEELRWEIVKVVENVDTAPKSLLSRNKFDEVDKIRRQNKVANTIKYNSTEYHYNNQARKALGKRGLLIRKSSSSRLYAVEGWDLQHSDPYDQDSSSTWFTARLVGYSPILELKNMLSFTVKTKPDFQHHRSNVLIIAHQEFERAVKHFEAHGLLGIHGEWVMDNDKPSDNLMMFNKALQNYPRPHGDEILKQAALSTWTGKQAVRQGYTEVEVLKAHTTFSQEKGHYTTVNVVFRKGSPPN